MVMEVIREQVRKSRMLASLSDFIMDDGVIRAMVAHVSN